MNFDFIFFVSEFNDKVKINKVIDMFVHEKKSI